LTGFQLATADQPRWAVFSKSADGKTEYLTFKKRGSDANTLVDSKGDAWLAEAWQRDAQLDADRKRPYAGMWNTGFVDLRAGKMTSTTELGISNLGETTFDVHFKDTVRLARHETRNRLSSTPEQVVTFYTWEEGELLESKLPPLRVDSTSSPA